MGPSFLPSLRPMSFSFRPPKKEENSTSDIFFFNAGGAKSLKREREREIKINVFFFNFSNLLTLLIF